MMDSGKTGRYIAEQRKLLRITQRELADMLGVTNRTVSKWETGTGMPDIGVLPALAEILGTTVDCILSGEDAEISGDIIVEIDEGAIVNDGDAIERKDKKLAKYILDKQIMQFKIECTISVSGGIMSILVFFVMTQLNFNSMIYAYVLGLLIDGIAFVTFLVFFFQMQNEIEVYNQTFKENVSFRKIWRNYAISGMWLWSFVPTMFVVYMILTLTFGFNRIVFGIIWAILYISVCIPIIAVNFHK